VLHAPVAVHRRDRSAALSLSGAMPLRDGAGV
jgi:hypothetical protein